MAWLARYDRVGQPGPTTHHYHAFQSRKFLNCSGRSVTVLRTSAIASCSVSFLAPETRSGVALDARLDLQLAVLDELDEVLGALLLDALADLDLLLDLVAAHRLDPARLERPGVDAALGELAGQHVAHLAQLELVVGEDGERLFLVVDLDPRVGALEVEAVRDLLVGLVHGVADLDVVHFGHDIEGRHDCSPFQFYRIVRRARRQTAREFPGALNREDFLIFSGLQLRGDAQAQRVQPDEALGVGLVVGAVVVLEGGDRGIEQRIGLRASGPSPAPCPCRA